MPLAWASVIGKMTRSLRSSSARNTTSTVVAVGSGRPAFDLGHGRETRGRIDGDAAVRADRSRPERQRRDVPFADGTQAQDEPTAVCRRAGLVGMAHDARIEQGRRLERVLVQEVGSDQAALRLVQDGMRLQRVFHLGGARLEDLEQVAVTAFEILEHFGELPRGSPGLEAEEPCRRYGWPWSYPSG